MTESSRTKTDNYYYLQEAINSILEVNGRIDERVKMIVEKQEEFKEKLSVLESLKIKLEILENNLKNAPQDVISLSRDLKDIESRVQDLEKIQTKSENHWKTFLNFGVQIVWVLVAAWLLLKLGLNTSVLSTP